MTLFAGLFTGVFLSAQVIAIYRSFFVLSQFPFFHLPIIFFIFLLELIIGFLLFNKISNSLRTSEMQGLLDKWKIFSIPLAFSSIYITILILLISGSKIILGLSYSATLPWYALTIYPLLIFAPLAVPLGILLKKITLYKPQVGIILCGSFLYLLTDFFLIHRLDIIYSALLAAAFGFIVLIISAPEKFYRVIYSAAAIIMVLIIFSSIPRNLTDSINGHSRDEDTTLITHAITPYGEFHIRKNTQDNIYSFSLNHSEIYRYPDTENIQQLAHLSMVQYPWAERILVIGESSCLVQEILKYPNIKSVYWGNPVPQSFKIIDEVVPSLINKQEKLRILSKSDPRLFVRNLRYEEIFDVAIISLPDPSNIFFNRYYTQEFFQELKLSLSENSMVVITITTPEEYTGINHRFLTASIYKTLKKTFPNLLTIYGKNSQILASHNRNFTTSYPALSEFLNILDERPHYISPALIRNRMNAAVSTPKKLNIAKAAVNLDSRPASLKHSLNELMLTFGIFSAPVIEFINNIKSLPVYIAVTIFIIIFIKLFSKKPLDKKIKFLIIASSFSLLLFIYNLSLTLQSLNGQIFRFISLILASSAGGWWLSFNFLKNRPHQQAISRIRCLLMLVGLFLILIPTFFEITLFNSSVVFLVILLIAGGFFFSGIIYEGLKTFNEGSFLNIFYGFLIALVAAILIIPALGTIETLPVLGIISFGGVVLLSS